MDIHTFVLIAQTTTLMAASLLLVYPVVAYGQNVAYTRGLLLLAGAFLVLMATYVASFVFHMSLVSAALDLTAALLAAGGVWEFARPFVRISDRGFETPTADETTGGFESAGDD